MHKRTATEVLQLATTAHTATAGIIDVLRMRVDMIRVPPYQDAVFDAAVAANIQIALDALLAAQTRLPKRLK